MALNPYTPGTIEYNAHETCSYLHLTNYPAYLECYSAAVKGEPAPAPVSAPEEKREWWEYIFAPTAALALGEAVAEAPVPTPAPAPAPILAPVPTPAPSPVIPTPTLAPAFNPYAPGTVEYKAHAQCYYLYETNYPGYLQCYIKAVAPPPAPVPVLPTPPVPTPTPAPPTPSADWEKWLEKNKWLVVGGLAILILSSK